MADECWVEMRQYLRQQKGWAGSCCGDATRVQNAAGTLQKPGVAQKTAVLDRGQQVTVGRANRSQGEAALTREDGQPGRGAQGDS